MDAWLLEAALYAEEKEEAKTTTTTNKNQKNGQSDEVETGHDHDGRRNASESWSPTTVSIQLDDPVDCQVRMNDTQTIDLM